MKRISIGIIVGLFSVFPSYFEAQVVKGGSISSVGEVTTNWYGKSVALVIGIDSYSGGWPVLSSACADADKVAISLKNQHFVVYSLLNGQATKSQIMHYLYDVIPPQLGENDRLVIYFAGHGQTQESPGGQLGYIIPADGKRVENMDQWSTYISMKELRNVLLDQYSAKHVLVISDSCFSGLLTTKSIGTGVVVSRALKYKGRMILTAGGKDEQAVDGLFAPILVDALDGQADTNDDNAVTFGEICLYVQQNVAAKSNQRPVYGWWEGNGEMVFAYSGSPDSTHVFSVTPTPSFPPINTNLSTDLHFSKPASLIVNTNPWVEIYLNKKQVGISPYKNDNIQPGLHKVRIENHKFGIDIQRDVLFGEGASIRISNVDDLNKIGKTSTSEDNKSEYNNSYGRLSVVTQPLVDVFLDGVYLGQSPVDEEIPTGKHILLLKSDIHSIEIKHTVTIKSGITLHIGPAPNSIKESEK